MRIVVAGAGLAGLRAAQAARGAGFEGELVLVGDESHVPYTRPPLSKELLAGGQTAAQCTFPGFDVLEAELRLGVAVIGLDAAACTLTLADGETLGYDRLILATGARARPWPGRAPGDPARVHTLRGLDDAHALKRALQDPATHRLAIVGAGFVGCEVAATARGYGLEVTLIDVADQPLLPLGPQLGARVAQLHVDHGVDLRLGAGVESIDDGSIALSDGTIVTADRILVALGALPNTDFLHDTPIRLGPDGGVLCDATLTSVSDPAVLAAGDIAAWPALGGRFGDTVRVEHWTTAAEHGRIAGANAAHEPAQRRAHVAPPYFWSDQYDCKIQSVGFPATAERVEIVDEDTTSDPARLVAEARDADDRLVGAVAFNHAKRLAEYRRRLAREAVPA
jgi:3-phenylpropionate/trans-cinnamate dioxygenase ferredoxin reductase component